MKFIENDEQIKRDLYLKKLQLGEIQGPKIGIPNIDKPWLKHYSDEQIKSKPIMKTAYRYMLDENEKFSNDCSIIFMGRKIKYYQLFDEINKVAKSLKQMGVKSGDIVTACLPNIPEAAYLFYACSMIGAVVDFIDPRENEEGLEKYLNISNPKHLIMLDMCFDNFKNLIDKKHIKNVVITSPIESLPYPIMFGMNLKTKITNRKNDREKNIFMDNSSANFILYRDFINNGKNYEGVLEEDYSENKPVAIVHTGGTTGVPKGVLLSNENLNELVNQLKNSDLQFLRHNLLMDVMPAFVGYGLSVGLHNSIVCGMKTMMVLKYEPEKIPEAILKYKPNALAGSPAHWEIFSKSSLINKDNVDLSFLTAPIEGGDTLNVKVEKKLNEIFEKHNCDYKMIKGYGLSEVCSAATVCSNNSINELKSVGVPLVKTNIAIYDEENDKNLPYNNIGEICLCAPNVMLEYFNNKSETDNVIKTHSDGKKWLHSGDIGYITNDGLLYVVDRKKDIVIRYDGIKIYPSDVENILLKHPAIDSIAVVGIDDPEHFNGEIPIAFPLFNEKYDKKEAMDSLINYAQQYVADYAVPIEYFPIDNMPITKVGKIDKKLLRELIENSDDKKKILIRDYKK